MKMAPGKEENGRGEGDKHDGRCSVRATVDGGAELAGDPKLNIFTE